MKTPEFYFPSCMLTWEKIMVMPLLLLVAPDYYSVLLSVVSFYFSFFKTLIYLFIYVFIWEIGEGKEKERARHINVREKHQSLDFHTCPDGALNQQPEHVPWPGSELVTFRCVGWCPTNWATPARAVVSISIEHCSLLGSSNSILCFVLFLNPWSPRDNSCFLLLLN